MYEAYFLYSVWVYDLPKQCIIKHFELVYNATVPTTKTYSITVF